MSKLIDMTGMQIGEWTVLGRGRTEPLSPGHPGTRVFWKVRCSCGTEKELPGALLKRKNPSRSCGCKTGELVSKAKLVHGHNRHKKPSRTYASWAMMVNRTCNPLAHDWQYYGGRGITLDPKWRSFEKFLIDMGERPLGTTIDRKNNSRGYNKNNCRWATYKEQSNNRRNSKKKDMP